jgi:hypothetical protein
MDKKYKLNKEKVADLEIFEKGKLKPSCDQTKLKQEVLEAAKSLSRKNERLNIRIPMMTYCA